MLSTTLPTPDGVNILQHSPQLTAFLNHATNGRHVVPIGRLDKDSHGLLLLTTDEKMTGYLLRPSSTTRGSILEKEYLVTTRRRVSDRQLEQLRHGVNIKVANWKNARESVKTRQCTIHRVPRAEEAGEAPRVAALPAPSPEASKSSSTVLRFLLREGKNRQIRKMLGALSHSVVDLQRTRFGSISLGQLQAGQACLLDEEEMQEILEAVKHAREMGVGVHAVAGPTRSGTSCGL